MPFEFVFYPDPGAAPFTITPDSGGAYASVPYTHTSGRLGGAAYIADATPDQQGATLTINMEGFKPAHMRGFLRVYPDTMIARLEVDDYHLEPLAPTTPPPTEPTYPPPPHPEDPHAVILWVYDTGAYDLTTERGCGAFVEACAYTLFTYTAPMWGHVAKFPGQVQINGHAIDAIHCLAGEYSGIWDIIIGNSAPGATPAFNYTGPADPAIWYPGNRATPPAARAAITRRQR